MTDKLKKPPEGDRAESGADSLHPKVKTILSAARKQGFINKGDIDRLIEAIESGR